MDIYVLFCYCNAAAAAAADAAVHKVFVYLKDIWVSQRRDVIIYYKM